MYFKIKKLGFSLLNIGLLLLGCLIGQHSVLAAGAETQPAQVMVDIYDPPVPFEALDKMYLVYELYVTNFYNTDITLDALQVHDKDTDTPLLGFDKKSLSKMVRKTCLDNTKCDELLIPPGGMKLVYLMLPFNSQNDLPQEIVQRLFITRKDDGSQAELKTLPLKVNKTMTVMVRPPVKGDYWVAVNGLASLSPHRTTHWVMNGQNYFAQRYAIDFMQIDLDGKTFQGNELDNASYYAYGKEVLAVARGTVVAIKDGLPDNKPQLSEGKAVKINNEDIAGNYVILELAKGLYAFYGHLRPGSIKVKVGEKVAEGQVLAQIGSSGNSKLPHLHFHIADRPTYLGGNGIPYTFTEFWVRPSEIIDSGTQKLHKFIETPDGLKRYSNQAVIENTVIKFNNEERFNKERKNAFNEEDEETNTPRASIPTNMNTAKPAVIREENTGQPSVRASGGNSYNNPNYSNDNSRNAYNNNNNNRDPNMQQNPNMQRSQNPRVISNRNARPRTTQSDTRRQSSDRDHGPFQVFRSLFGLD